MGTDGTVFPLRGDDGAGFAGGDGFGGQGTVIVVENCRGGSKETRSHDCQLASCSGMCGELPLRRCLLTRRDGSIVVTAVIVKIDERNSGRAHSQIRWS